MNINPKVHSGATTAFLGGGSAAIGLMWLMQSVLGVPESEFTQERVAFLTAACAWIGSYIGGYLKKD